MNDIYSPNAVKERENYIIDHIGLPASVLMERAGLFLADEADFSEERITAAGIGRRYRNEALDDCLAEIVKDMIHYV